MTKKYNYHDYKLPNKNPLPVDINKLPLEIAGKLDKTGVFVEFLKDFQDKKLFGDVNFIDPNVNPPRLTASFELHSGMCKKFKLISYMDNNLSHSIQTILNDKIDFRKVK